MKKIVKVLIGMVASLCLCLGLSGCGKEKIPELTDKLIISLGEEAILNEVYYDKIVDIKYKEVETSEEELAKLKEAFTSSLPYKTYYVTANISSISMSANVEFNITYVYNAEWQAFYCHDVNTSNWKYVPKEDVSIKSLMTDISKLQIGDFEKGYVGDDRYSSIEITNIEFDDSINREDVSFTATVTTDYGKVKINGVAIYYFQKGVWCFGDMSYDTIDKWQIQYNDNVEFQYGADYVKSKLITKNEFLTYVANENYYSKCELSSPVVSPTKDGIICKYIFSTVYNGIGTIQYAVNVKYDWLIYEWGEGSFSVAVDNIDINSLLGKTYYCGDKSLVVKSVKKATEDEHYIGDKLSSSDTSIDINFAYKNGTETYDIWTNFNVLLRDDNYEAKLFKVTDGNGNDIDMNSFTIISLYVSNNTISFNGEIYKLEDRTPAIDETTSTAETIGNESIEDTIITESSSSLNVSEDTNDDKTE